MATLNIDHCVHYYSSCSSALELVALTASLILRLAERTFSSALSRMAFILTSLKLSVVFLRRLELSVASTS